MTINPEEHLGLVYMVVSKYAPKGISIEDTEEYSEGVLALIIAASKYDYEKHKNEFSTFAVRCIQTALIQRWRKQRCQKRDGTLVPLDGQAVEAPVKYDHYDFLLSLFADHRDDTPEDRRNKRVLFDHFVNEMTWQEIGDQMASRYGQIRPVTRACARLYAEAALQLIRTRFKIEKFTKLEEILS